MSATLDVIHDAIRNVQSAQKYISGSRRTDAIVETITAAAKSWLPSDSLWRARAVEQAPKVTGFSPAMVNEAIERVFGSITTDALRVLLERELGDRLVLDEFRPHGQTRARAFGVPLVVHLLAGNVPAPGILSVICGLLVKSGNIVRASRRDTVFPSLFVESLRAIDAELAKSVAVLEWPRTEMQLTQAAIARADVVIAQGDDSTIAALRRIAPPGATFLGYGQKTSFAYLAREAMTADQIPSLAAAVADDVSVYDQQGCLSPHVVYVEERGALGPRKFAAALAEAMAAFQARIPRGELTTDEATAVTLTRQSYEYRAASDRRCAVWNSPQPNDWSVIYDDDPEFEPSCLNRVVFVKPTDGTARVLKSITRFISRISTVGVAPQIERMTEFANQLAALGVHRVCPVGRMQRPPLWWYHDGQPNLASLVRWTEFD
jgi:hypothetical protein